LPLAASAWGKKKTECCDPCPTACAEPCAAACAPAAPCGPVTVQVTEMVPEYSQVAVTKYKHETKTETYTAYKCETVQEPVTSTYTVNTLVTECVMEPRTKCVKVPVTECVTEMCSKWVRVEVTEYKEKCVDNGHYECVEVPVKEGCFSGLFKKHDPCACDPCPKTKTVKKWVSCPTTVCEPVCKKKWVKECYPVTKQVCTYKTEHVTEMVSVKKTKCVPEVKTCTTMVCKTISVPYQATRCVTVCVPYTENVTVCKMVAKCVTKTLNCENPCAPAAVPSCCH